MAESSRPNNLNTCWECRRRKRACDKARPSCSRCERNGRTCVYKDDTPTGSAEDFRRLQAQVASLERTLEHLSATSTAPLRRSEYVRNEGTASTETSITRSLFFFDSSTFLGRKCQYPVPTLAAVGAIIDELGEEYEVHVPRVLDRYFSTVHDWLPIISKVRLERRLPSNAADLKAGTGLLVLCMKLVISDPSGEEDGSTEEMYQLARISLMNLGPETMPSLDVLQAAILIAVFELGHGMYPAAFLSVGYAVALANTVGLDNYPSSPAMFGPPQNQTELEERKRTQWAVLLLDRFIVIGGHGRALQTREPGLDRPLPCDDSQFNVGEFALSSTIGAIHTAANRQSSFARTCQVTHLLGSVKRHLDSQEIDKTRYGAEGLQLHRTTTALATAVQEELEQGSGSLSSGLWSSMALCFSTLFMLYEAHCHAPETWVTTSEQQEMQVIAADGLRKTTRAVAKYTQHLKIAIEQSDLGEVSILACECIFSAASMCVWFVGETGEAEASDMLAELRSSLQVVQGRWRVAKSMLEVVDWEERAFDL